MSFYALCSPAMMALDDVAPTEYSKILFDKYGCAYMVAHFPFTPEKLHELTDGFFERHKDEMDLNCFWYPIEASQLECEDYQPRVMRKQGLQSYFYNHENLSKDCNFAFAIHNYSYWEGKTPVEFFNSVPYLFKK